MCMCNTNAFIYVQSNLRIHHSVNNALLFDTYIDSKAGSECRRHFASHIFNQLMEAHDVRITILTSFVYIDRKNQVYSGILFEKIVVNGHIL